LLLISVLNKTCISVQSRKAYGLLFFVFRLKLNEGKSVYKQTAFDTMTGYMGIVH
jgi:hypothetical protein